MVTKLLLLLYVTLGCYSVVAIGWLVDIVTMYTTQAWKLN